MIYILNTFKKTIFLTKCANVCT